MAEPLTVLSTVSSVIQLVDFTTKVVERVKHYIHCADEVPETLRDIDIQLPLFIDSLRRIQIHIDFGHFNPEVSSALQIMIHECCSHMRALDDLMKRLTPEQGDSRLTKTRKAILSLKDEKTLERIFSKVSGYIEMLLRYQISIASTHTMVNIRSLLRQVENASSLSTTMSIDSVSTTGDSRSLTFESSTPLVAPKTLANYFNQKKQRRISYFLGLAKFGLLWAIQADLDLSWGNYGFSISPSLQFQRLVKNISPGYQWVTKCLHRNVDIQTACKELFKLFQRGVISPWDTFPDGATWLEKILRMRLLESRPMLDFLKVLCNCGAPKKAKTPLLALTASFNRFGFHLKLVKELLASGYDCSLDTTQTVLPASVFFEDSRSLEVRLNSDKDNESEPFLLLFLKECSKYAYGVWGQTPMMDSILCGSKSEISVFLEYSDCLQGKNALGQTAFHLAILRPDVLSLLLDTHSNLGVADFNQPDSYGNSPLIYAAAYGYTGSVIALLKAGANPLTEGHLGFVQWALNWNHWDLAAEALTFLRATARASDALIQSELRRIMAALRNRSEYHWDSPPELLQNMLNLGLDKHMPWEDGRTLLHLAPSSEWADCLFDAGFNQIHHCDIEGETALMTFPNRITLVRNILARGCNVNHQNNRGETALHNACIYGRFKWRHEISRTNTVTAGSFSFEEVSGDLASIATLLHQGADTSIRDNCRCPCAPDGCSAILQFLPGHEWGAKGYLWVLECLIILNDIQGPAVAQKALFDIYRVREFELAGMTHVCCRERPIFGEPRDGAEINEIIDEEIEFVAILEETMRNRSLNSDNESVEEGWLSLIGSFWAPDQPFKCKKYWRSYDKNTGFVLEEAVKLTTDPISPHNTTSKTLVRVDEERDLYWVLRTSIEGVITPQRSIYSAWVEWVYQNPDRYDYPLPVDRNWYEKRKYWATRQAEVLEGLPSLST